MPADLRYGCELPDHTFMEPSGPCLCGKRNRVLNDPPYRHGQRASWKDMTQQAPSNMPPNTRVFVDEHD